MIKICKFCNKPVKCVNQHLSKKHITEECEWVKNNLSSDILRRLYERKTISEIIKLFDSCLSDTIERLFIKRQMDFCAQRICKK
jgi:hypothetical protein